MATLQKTKPLIGHYTSMAHTFTLHQYGTYIHTYWPKNMELIQQSWTMQERKKLIELGPQPLSASTTVHTVSVPRALLQRFCRDHVTPMQRSDTGSTSCFGGVVGVWQEGRGVLDNEGAAHCKACHAA